MDIGQIYSKQSLFILIEEEGFLTGDYFVYVYIYIYVCVHLIANAFPLLHLLSLAVLMLIFF
jgi:hypothetical protein